MDNSYKVFQKILVGKSFYNDGIEYNFISVQPDEKGWSYDIIIDVILPKKGQSYATPKFSKDIHDILVNLFGYVGSSFSYSEKILINGKEPINNGVYISYDKQEEVLNAVRKKIKTITLKSEEGQLKFDIKWSMADKFFYRLDDVYIDFYFFVYLSNFTIEGKHVVPNLKLIDEIAGVLTDMMYDNDGLKNAVDDTIYDVMNDEIDITGVDDLYFQGLIHIKKIDGLEVHPTSSHWEISPEMFTII